MRQITDAWRADAVRLSSGTAPDTCRDTARHHRGAVVAGDGAPPAPPRTGPISGYMDFHINRAQHGDAVLDFHRFVLLFAHSFSDRIRFCLGAGAGARGRLERDRRRARARAGLRRFPDQPALQRRAGMVLAPIGIINERHEPPVFHGVERPAVDTVIVPTTWFGAGAAYTGRSVPGFATALTPWRRSTLLGSARRRGCVTAGRRVRSRTPGTSPVRGGSSTSAPPGSCWARASGAVTRGFGFPRVDSSVTLAEVDGRYRYGEIGIRGQYAHVFLDGMGELNRAVLRTVGVSPNAAEQMRGFYLEGSYYVVPRPAPREVAVFVRYENFDTQYRMPAGFQPLPEFDRDAWIIGVTYFPDPDVAVKIDYTILATRAMSSWRPIRSISVWGGGSDADTVPAPSGRVRGTLCRYGPRPCRGGRECRLTGDGAGSRTRGRLDPRRALQLHAIRGACDRRHHGRAACAQRRHHAWLSNCRRRGRYRGAKAAAG